MNVHPRTPVVVGVAQTLRRPADPAEATEPIEQMVEALHLAAADSGAGHALLERADSIAVPKVVSWPYLDPASLVAARLGLSPTETVYCSDGGNTPQRLVNDATEAIVRGERDVVLLVGAEATYTRLAARKRQAWLPWPKQTDAQPTRFVGETAPGLWEEERAAGLDLPVHVYPLFENALAAASGVDPTVHRAAISALWSEFSDVAARNPHAWTPRRVGADEIATPTAANRMVAWPYTKLMCANSATDQAAAVVLCSAEAADRAGVPRDRWVFPWSGADAHEHWFLSQRANLWTAPALRIAAATALDLAATTLEDLAHVDLYACFPAAVQIAAAELGLPLRGDRLTVTGGNAFAGAPGNNFAMHAIAATVATLRAEESARALVTGVGWWLTKHSVGIYGTHPPPTPFRREVPQGRVDALPNREIVGGYTGDMAVETFTVVYDRAGEPERAVIAGLTPTGNRVWGATTEPSTLHALEAGDLVGAPAHRGLDGVVKVA
ncbi:MAG: acetyl-CoA acetyltransferase [Sporichthyaceae bacterium]